MSFWRPDNSRNPNNTTRDTIKFDGQTHINAKKFGSQPGTDSIPVTTPYFKTEKKEKSFLINKYITKIDKPKIYKSLASFSIVSWHNTAFLETFNIVS